MGLVNKVVPFDRLEEETIEWCRTILKRSPMAIRMIKRALNAELDGQRGLMEFAGEQKEIPSEALSDVMLLDLYLRENLKSRPSFASDQKPYERMIWDYRKAEKIPKTAHIEVFRDGKKILFDYTDRDPLTNNARLTDITDEVNKNYGNV